MRLKRDFRTCSLAENATIGNVSRLAGACDYAGEKFRPGTVSPFGIVSNPSRRASLSIVARLTGWLCRILQLVGFCSNLRQGARLHSRWLYGVLQRRGCGGTVGYQDFAQTFFDARCQFFDFAKTVTLSRKSNCQTPRRAARGGAVASSFLIPFLRPRFMGEPEGTSVLSCNSRQHVPQPVGVAGGVVSPDRFFKNSSVLSEITAGRRVYESGPFYFQSGACRSP